MLLSSPVHAVIEPLRAVSVRALVVKYVARQNVDSWNLTHLERFV